MSERTYTVIDTIHLGKWIIKHPEFARTEEGMIAILDPLQITGKPEIPENKVKVIKPDGSTIELIVAEIETNRREMTALFFKDARRNEIPRLSKISW
ncbi:MAG: hypothetical protein KF726_21335 [Anaerolineae bacterium]|nr:hypothetical protein [Anaerolineae bacterium]